MNGILLVIITYYAVRFLEQRSAFKDRDHMMRYELWNFPHNPRSWIYKASTALNTSNFPRAYYFYEEGLKHCPTDCKLNFFMGAVLMCLGQGDRARKHLIKAREIGIDVYNDEVGAMVQEMLDKINELRKPSR